MQPHHLQAEPGHMQCHASVAVPMIAWLPSPGKLIEMSTIRNRIHGGNTHIDNGVVPGSPPGLLLCELVELGLVRMPLEHVADGGIVLRADRGCIASATVVVPTQ